MFTPRGCDLQRADQWAVLRGNRFIRHGLRICDKALVSTPNKDIVDLRFGVPAIKRDEVGVTLSKLGVHDGEEMHENNGRKMKHERGFSYKHENDQGVDVASRKCANFLPRFLNGLEEERTAEFRPRAITAAEPKRGREVLTGDDPLALQNRRCARHGNNPPICLLSVVYKLFTRVILNGISRTVDEGQPFKETGFRRGFSTIDHIHTIADGSVTTVQAAALPSAHRVKMAFDPVETEAWIHDQDLTILHNVVVINVKRRGFSMGVPYPKAHHKSPNLYLDVGPQLGLTKTIFMRNGQGREVNMLKDLVPDLDSRKRAAWGVFKSVEELRLRDHLFFLP
ncbi:unnamed protein product [Heligmosomoides polygyrus]|uniref:Reverse transcriptase domain-containing protein n=1 Tax=Heligmosomoides polygyrus TaxID=6339 RepID=A0A183GFT1_HELPZ|nr:unnamed protein product [Heligmosomoides polygyrus]